MSGKETEDVYRDRNLLACALAQATDAPSGWKPAPDNPENWGIVWIETPMGQVSWHVPREMAECLAPVRRYSDYDGYDRQTKNDRLASWCDEGCWG